MILILAVVFVVLLIVVGGDRGVVSFLSLCGNLAVLCLSVMAMTWGVNVIVITAAACILINAITILYQNGRNQKTVAALLSTAVVLILMFVLIYYVSGRAHISGLNEIELQSDYGMYYSFDLRINMRQVCVSMIIIGLIGAIMDTAVAVTSAVFEVHENNRQLTEHQLRQSGLAIGRDILGTTLNTLYFAYIGEAFLFIIYLRQYNYSLVKMLNSKAFLSDLISILFSAVGCVLVIPLSAFIAARIMKNYREEVMKEKTNVMRKLDSMKLSYKEHFYTHSDAIAGVDVAAAMNQSPEQVFKTLVTNGKTGTHYVFMIPVAEELDLKKAAKAVGEKSIEMLKSKELLGLTGYVHGGCSPIGMKKFFRTTIHQTAANLETFIFSGGKIGYQVELSPAELKRVIDYQFADVIKEKI